MAEPVYSDSYESRESRRPYATPLGQAASSTIVAPYRRRSFARDVAAGAFYGDFARDLRLPGAVMQIVLAFIPLIGTICAIRDLIADLRHHDRLGAFLNVLALTPILGGFSKTLEVVRGFAHVGHAIHASNQRREQRVGPASPR